MSEQSLQQAVLAAAPVALTLRRILFLSLVGLTMAAMIGLLAVALSAGGFGLVDFILVVLFAVTLPWMVIGFWNATIGFLVMRLARDPVATVTPTAARRTGREPITASTAVVICIRNEPPERPAAFLMPLLQGLAASEAASRFHLYILSDTDNPSIAQAEERQFATMAETWRERLRITYRRREANTAFKAGNIRDFCDRWGKDHDFALVLDADSVMTAAAVLRLVRIMQAEPELGILQSLVIGMPSASAFARLFQFGMRLGMRSYTIGSAWWQADCGPYWGHNAIIRLAPFMAHCHLPTLPDNALVGGHVLSHDQVEAVLMRRAGFAVRVLTDEGDSFEQNPPKLIESIRRDVRWSQGNKQYWHFLQTPGLKLVIRYQLMVAILMFLGSPAWMALLLLGTAALAVTGSSEAFMRADAGIAVFVLVLVMWFAPKIATIIDVLARPSLRRSFGGGWRFLAGVVVETIFTLMLLPIMWFGHTMFLIRLLTGRKVGWTAQARADPRVPWAIAARALWPQTVLGWAVLLVLGATVPAAIPYALFIAGGLALSIPLAILTTMPAAGPAMVRIGLCQLPEETAPPPELTALALPAIEAARRRKA